MSLKDTVAGYSDQTLTVLLLLAAGVVIFIALQRDRPWLKAATLAYVLLP